MKNTLVVSHERSGTHLVINLINHENNGNFKSIGIEKSLKNDILNTPYDSSIIFKSHHHVQFFETTLFENYKVIYVKRDIKDTLTSYYYFMNQGINNMPSIENWIFSKPEKNISDFTQSENYITRIIGHHHGWMKYKNNLLLVNYEDILNNYKIEKEKIEKYLNKKILEYIPNIYDTKLLCFSPKFGKIGSHKKIMNEELIKKIDNLIATIII